MSDCDGRDVCVDEVKAMLPHLAKNLDPLFDKVVKQCLKFLEECSDPSAPVIEHRTYEALKEELGDALSLPEEGEGLDGIEKKLEPVLRFQPRTGSVHFFNQLFAGFDVPSILADFITAVLNTTSYTYEIGPVTTLIEQELIDRLCQMVGFDEGTGIFAPGGSISNLMGFLLGRQHAIPSCRKEGIQGQKLVCFTSVQGHYSMSRAAMITGVGMNAVVKVACDRDGKMDVDDLREKAAKAKAEGKVPFLVFGTAGTTVLGQFDPIEEIAAVAKEFGMWFHIDGCLGSSVLFSEKHKDKMRGCHLADSISWNPHKMLGIGLQCSCILVKKKGLLRECNSSYADYLFHPGAEEQDVGDMTLQCGRRLDTLKLWLSWQAHGADGYQFRVDQAFSMAEKFHDMIAESSDRFQLVTETAASVHSCFWVLPMGVTNATDAPDAVTRYAHAIRARLMKRGRILINYQPLKDQGYPYFFRIVTHNPFISEEDLEWVIEEFEAAMEAVDGSGRVDQ